MPSTLPRLGKVPGRVDKTPLTKCAGLRFLFLRDAWVQIPAPAYTFATQTELSCLAEKLQS